VASAIQDGTAEQARVAAELESENAAGAAAAQQDFVAEEVFSFSTSAATKNLLLS
jgi:hypothetical protein